MGVIDGLKAQWDKFRLVDNEFDHNHPWMTVGFKLLTLAVIAYGIYLIAQPASTQQNFECVHYAPILAQMAAGNVCVTGCNAVCVETQGSFNPLTYNVTHVPGWSNWSNITVGQAFPTPTS